MTHSKSNKKRGKKIKPKMLQSRTSSNASSDNTSNCTEVQLPLLVPPIKLWRKANLSDIPKIRILNVTTGEHIFGEFKLDELL